MNLKIVLFIFDDITILDLIGPYEVLSKIPNAEIRIVGLEKKDYKDKYGLTIKADCSIDEITETDILLIPGGAGIDSLLHNEDLIKWITEIDKSTKLTTSVCAGSIILAQAGLLDGKNCTTHWRRKDQLRKYNVNIVNKRYIQDGKYITSAGVSAGIDMALYLVSKIAGDQAAQIIQLAIEYDPKPPFDSGTPNKAPKEMVNYLISK